ncbi:WD40/YVTN/BNR-like repeat-containing protein [Catenuloplanes indicus]|uniref:Photosynthesis system II assembly factor Ycf48/Hcf136-like domain-containing protein n=1 Tax=Catenuloplanes indicus TaxID=137267 RepID=A0AAE4B095_9ACTN|nr:hypothetical protein [Catenuloplanes indicus]MDQ0368416.1 hypothetical protein [Catenuloplanes indicus]
MPAEDPSLDERLDAARNDVLGRISQPPLGALRARAHAHRTRRRRAAAAAVATLAVLTGGAVALRPQFGGDTGRGTPIAAVPVTASPSASADTSVTSSDGITLIGLEDGAEITELPGRIGQVAFVDKTTGYVLNDCTGDPRCTRTLARTTDGGRRWETSPVDTDLDITELNAFAGGTVVLGSKTESLVSGNSGRDWTRVPNEGSSAHSLTDGDVMCRRQAEGGAFKTAALSTGGRAVALATQPALDVRWVAPAATASRAWWVAGVDQAGKAAVAVTHDAGKSWDLHSFGTGGVEGISVAVRNEHVYVIVTGEDDAVLAIHHSTDGGDSFHTTRTAGSTGKPGSVSGEAVPLPDGRLLVASGGATWWVSADHGATFTKLTGPLPNVGDLRRTTAGWVAENLYGSGYVAFSTDGLTWQKLWIN